MSATELNLHLKNTPPTAAEFRAKLEAANYLSDIGPIREVIRHSALTLDERAALNKFATQREDDIYQAYLGRSMYRSGHYAGD